MSLLDHGREDILVYPEVEYTDRDGNILTGPAEQGVPARATIHPAAQSGTSARRAEQSNEGFETEAVYTMRLPRSFPHVLNAQARISWRGQRWAIHGDGLLFNGSDRTAHVQYTIKRT